MAIIKAKNISIYNNGAWQTVKNGKVYDGSQWRDLTGTAIRGARIRYNGNWYYTEPYPPMVIVGDGNIMYSDGGATWV
jgi:hypothetical protein